MYKTEGTGLVPTAPQPAQCQLPSPNMDCTSRQRDRQMGRTGRTRSKVPSTFGCRCGLTLPAPSRSLNPELPCLGRMHIHQGTPQGKFWLHTGDFSKIQAAPPYSRSTTGYANKTGFQGLPKPKKLPPQKTASPESRWKSKNRDTFFFVSHHHQRDSRASHSVRA